MLIAVWMCALAGCCAALIGLLALRRARAEIDDCRILLARAASGAGDLKAIRDVAVCRYDALEEMTGRLSFSVAMINALGDGIVLTSINGRSETRTYVRAVTSGRGEHPLAPEEEEAVRAARLGLGPLVTKARAPRQPADTLYPCPDSPT
ncbi:DUF4446 family protein [Nocardia aurea]|uniref:DUF4446 family protein n=1 Tax=Nocardia aurea TaxID=2144174 RepID=UPI0018E4E9C0|nr:DUF4446 family protein [Nocardia aurea]